MPDLQQDEKILELERQLERSRHANSKLQDELLDVYRENKTRVGKNETLDEEVVELREKLKEAEKKLSKETAEKKQAVKKSTSLTKQIEAMNKMCVHSNQKLPDGFTLAQLHEDLSRGVGRFFNAMKPLPEAHAAALSTLLFNFYSAVSSSANSPLHWVWNDANPDWSEDLGGTEICLVTMCYNIVVDGRHGWTERYANMNWVRSDDWTQEQFPAIRVLLFEDVNENAEPEEER